MSARRVRDPYLIRPVPLRGLDRHMSGFPHDRAVAVIGTGRVGSVLAAVLAEAGFPVSTGRTGAASADLIIIAVPDDALPGVAAGLAVRPGQVVAHTSGAHGIGVLAPAVAKGAQPLALHP